MKKIVFVLVLFCAVYSANAQLVKPNPGYEITLNLKNYKDTVAYLNYYQFGNKMTAATAHHVKDGKIVFKGKGKLGKGMYTVFDNDKKPHIDFFIDDSTQNLQLKSDDPENYLNGVVALNSKLENDFFTYIKYLIAKNKELKDLFAKGKGLSKKDSIAAIKPQLKVTLKDIYNYEENFISQNKGSYIADVINLKIERTIRDESTDSLAVRKYYRNHYWDNVNFNDASISRNQFFGAKVNNYFDNVITPDIDTVIVEVDKFVNRLKANPTLTKQFLDHMVNKYEYSANGYDRVVIHIADTYFLTGKVKAFYKDQDEFNRIIKRAEKIRPLQVGKVAPDLAMIRASDRDKVAKMGFENVKNNDELTKAYFSNEKAINNLYLKMNSIPADYLIVAFWDVDCSHCKVEIPKLLDLYHEFQKEKKDVKVYSVYIYHEVDKYMKYLEENKLDWINVYDGVYYNNVVDKYEVHTTPVIYILDKNKVIKAKKMPVDKIRMIIEDLERKKK